MQKAKDRLLFADLMSRLDIVKQGVKYVLTIISMSNSIRLTNKKKYRKKKSCTNQTEKSILRS